MREHRGLLWIGAGVAAPDAYGFVATFQPDPNVGRILAAYDGIFVAGSLARGSPLPVADQREQDWHMRVSLLYFADCRARLQRLPEHHAAMVQWAMIIIMARRLARHHATCLIYQGLGPTGTAGGRVAYISAAVLRFSAGPAFASAVNALSRGVAGKNLRSAIDHCRPVPFAGPRAPERSP